jgi:hypothetical protein
MIFAVVVFFCISYGVRFRVYANHIKYDRKLEFTEKLDIDLDDISKYPKAALDLYREKKKYDAHIEVKEQKIERVEESF